MDGYNNCGGPMSVTDDVRSFFDRNFLSAFELDGKDRIVTIKAVERGELPKAGSSKKDRKPVLVLAETEKKLAINKTNAKTIMGLYGSNIKGWIGKKIVLFPTTTTFGR